MTEDEVKEETAELKCFDIPEVNIVIEGNVENVNITINHFDKEDE